jgi:hypothetical protein
MTMKEKKEKREREEKESRKVLIKYERIKHNHIGNKEYPKAKHSYRVLFLKSFFSLFTLFV